MSKYKVMMYYPDGTSVEEDNIFDTEEEAREHGLYCCDCYDEGAEVLHLSNPGDYPLSEDTADFEIIEVDE